MEFNAGLGDLSIFDLCFNQDHLVAATNASGIWRLPRTALESTGMGEDVAARVWTLYPNPAGDVATLGGPAARRALVGSAHRIGRPGGSRNSTARATPGCLLPACLAAHTS